MKPLFSTKQELRERILTLLRKQEKKERLLKSALIADKLLWSAEFKKAKSILFYASFDGEVDTFEMIKKAITLKKRVGLPVVDREKKRLVPVLFSGVTKDLQDGHYGIKQPVQSPSSTVPLNEIDLVVVPGLAFDKANNRLGRGQGYYDRFLKDIPRDTPTVGLAFDFQLVDAIPCLEAHDIKVLCVFSN